MAKVILASAVLCTALSAVAQNCTGPQPTLTLATYDPIVGSFYYGNAVGNTTNLMFDLTTQRTITISQIGVSTFDYLVGGTPPNQIGAVARANVYTVATTRIGNEAVMANWTLASAGNLTVSHPGYAPITSFNPPLVIPAGTYGICVELVPTTFSGTPTPGPNPGNLHPLGVSPNPALPWSDQCITISNDGIQSNGWQTVNAAGALVPFATPGNPTDSVNLKISYAMDAPSAVFTQHGDGCYFRARGFYEEFPASTVTGAIDLANTSQLWIFLGQNWVLTPGTASYVTPTSTPISSGTYTSSSSTNWDDAMQTVSLNGMTFPYPGGSTTDLTVSSNGHVYLANFVNSSYPACGPPYGSLAGWRDLPPRIAPLYADLDPSAGGGLHVDFDTATPPTWVRITWNQVPEWPLSAGFHNSIQLTLRDTGNVDLVYGALSLRSVANANTGVAGFSAGNGNRMPLGPIDITQAVALGTATGDGAIPPVLGMNARPVIGTSPNLVVNNITPGTTFSFFLASLGSTTPQGLSAFGMANCFSHVNYQPGTLVGAFLTGLTPQNQFVVAFPIPNDNSYQNVQFFFQAAPLTTGYNAAGILTSNGLCTKLGQ